MTSVHGTCSTRRRYPVVTQPDFESVAQTVSPVVRLAAVKKWHDDCTRNNLYRSLDHAQTPHDKSTTIFNLKTMITSGTLELSENALSLLTRPPAATRMLLIMQVHPIPPRHENSSNLLQMLLHKRLIPIFHRRPRILIQSVQFTHTIHRLRTRKLQRSSLLRLLIQTLLCIRFIESGQQPMTCGRKIYIFGIIYELVVWHVYHRVRWCQR